MARKLKKVGEWTFYRDKSSYDINLDTEGGEFSIYLKDYQHSIRGETLEKVREDARQYLEQHCRTEFKPMIVVSHGDRFHDFTIHAKNHNLAFSYERAFRGTRPDGEEVWRTWEADEPFPESGGGWDDAVKGKPGRVTHIGYHDTDVVIEYTAEKWKALRQLTRMAQMLQKKLQEIRSSAKRMDTFLLDIHARGTVPLLEQAPPKKKGR